MPVRPKTSARRNVEYDMRTKRVLSRRGCCLMWVNLVNKEVMQPIRLPTRKLAQKMPKKSRIAWKRRRLILSLIKILFKVYCSAVCITHLYKMPCIVLTADQGRAPAAHVLLKVFQSLREK